MPESVYGMVLGVQEVTLQDGRRVYAMFPVDPKDLPKYSPKGFPGWFVTRGEDAKTPIRLWPGDGIVLPAVEESSVPVFSASPVTRKA